MLRVLFLNRALNLIFAHLLTTQNCVISNGPGGNCDNDHNKRNWRPCKLISCLWQNVISKIACLYSDGLNDVNRLVTLIRRNVFSVEDGVLTLGTLA